MSGAGFSHWNDSTGIAPNRAKREVGRGHDLIVGDRGPDGAFRKLFPDRFDGVQTFVDGAVAVSMHVGLEAVACEAEQDGFQCWRGEVDGRTAILARSPARPVDVPWLVK